MIGSNLCTPAMIYFFMSLIYLVFKSLKSFNIMVFIIALFFIFAWSWFLNFLCSSGYSIISWILVVLPFLMAF